MSSGAVGIIEAGKENSCSMANNSVECVIASALEGSENTSTNTTLRLVRIEPSDDWLYWMAGREGHAESGREGHAERGTRRGACRVWEYVGRDTRSLGSM